MTNKNQFRIHSKFSLKLLFSIIFLSTRQTPNFFISFSTSKFKLTRLRHPVQSTSLLQVSLIPSFFESSSLRNSDPQPAETRLLFPTWSQVRTW